MAIISDIINKGSVAEESLTDITTKYPWFEVARLLNNQTSTRYTINYDKIREESDGEIIERFLRKGDYRIVAEEGDTDEEICTEASFDDEDEFVSEELAEIYLSQGLKMEAIEIYRKLSLLNTEKFAYFAEKIDAIQKNNKN